MNLKRFLLYFLRTLSPQPDKTEIQFSIHGKILTVQIIEFDIEANVWRVRLI